MPWTPININDTMRFRLTDLGKKIWLDYWRPYAGDAGPDLPSEEDGWFSAQIWVVASILGHHFSNGGPIVMETEILIRPEAAYATPSPSPTEGVWVRIAVALDDAGGVRVRLIGPDPNDAWQELADWGDATQRLGILAGTLPLPKLPEIEGAVETEAG